MNHLCKKIHPKNRGGYMRFALQDQLLVPDSLFSKDSDSKPITYINHFPQPPLNPDFPFNGELQNLLAGKQLLLSDLPFSHRSHSISL